MNDRIILHCDANSFYASVETANNPDLKDKAVAVAGDPKKRTGIILTRNQKAKICGVTTGEAIWQAKLKCPDLVCVSPNFPLYEKYSRHLRQIYESFTDKVEAFGIDECWLDITDTAKFFGTPEQIAFEIRQRVKKELNITVSVGISFCKLFAKLGSDMKKPDATTIISKQDFKNIIYPLPIDSIIGIGRRNKIKYNKINVYKLGEIVKVDDYILKKLFGKPGLELKQKLLGYDLDDVAKFDYENIVKSVGNGTTTIKDVCSKSEVKSVVNALSQEIATRLRYKKFLASGIAVTLKTANFKYFHHSNKMPLATCNAKDICDCAIRLINTFWEYAEDLRAIRICCYDLSSANQKQLNMFENTPKKNNLDSAIDKIRCKYGYDAIIPASMHNNKLDINRVSV